MTSVDVAMAWMRPGCWMFKVDIRHAYRNVGIHPECWTLTTFRWQGILWIDRCMPFGLNSAPETFTRFMRAVLWMMEQGDWVRLVAYLDDFFGVDYSWESALAKFEALKQLLGDLGLPLNEKPGKVVPPT